MPAWEVKGRGYINHEGQSVNLRSHKAMVWPKDKPSSTWWGRMSDVLGNRGPDIFVATNPNRKPSAIDGPSRRRWTGFPAAESDPITKQFDANGWRGSAPWACRSRGLAYDFRTRRYRRPRENGRFWSDARYCPEYSGRPTALEQWPHLNEPFFSDHIYGNTAFMDPKNFGAGGMSQGPNGGGAL